MPRVDALYAGSVGTLADGSASAIAKRPVAGRARVVRDGLVDDAQADRRHHGGPDQALLAYATAHYPAWDERLGRSLARPSFGENLAVSGRGEAGAVVGEVWRVGTTVLRVVQPRVPCSKPATLTGEPRMTAWMGTTGFTGWYLAVVEPGELWPGAEIEVAERPDGGVTIAEINRLRYRDRDDADGLERALAAPALHPDWRDLLARQLAALRTPR